MWKKLVSIFLCAVFFCLTLTACSQEETSINLPVSSIPTSLDPVIADGTAACSIAYNCYEGLVRIDEDGNVQPGAADHWSISDDGLTYTFTLRPGIQWHVPDADSAETAAKNPLGEDFILSFPTAMTADDFVFGLQRAVAKNTNAPGASRLFGIVNAEAIYNGEAKAATLGVTAVGEDTVRIRLSAPDGNFLAALASPVAMPCSRSFFKKTDGRYGLTPSLCLCNGPYYISTQNSAGTSVSISKNDSYVGAFEGSVDHCSFLLSTDTTSSDIVVSTGDDDKSTIDVLTDLSSDEGRLAGALLREDLESSIPKGYSITEYSDIVDVILFNMESEFAGNEDLRLALACATNPVTLVSENGRLAEGILPDCCESVGGTMYRLAAGKVSTLPFNLKKAKKYYKTAMEKFEAVATKDDPAPTSFDITFLCLEKDKNLAKTIVQNWQKVYGTDLSIVVETRATEAELNASLAAGRFDVAFAPLHCTELIATNVLRAYAGTTSANLPRLASDEYDEYIRAASSATDSETVTKYCKLAEQYLIENGIMIPVSQHSTLLAVNKKTADGLYVLPMGDTYAVYGVK